MGEWQVARLIPTWGVSSDQEAEMRASSAMLAVLSIVREFSSALLTPMGASSAKKATVETFIEVSFKLANGSVIRPDGLIRVTYGKNTFTALVELKTGNNTLTADQVNTYWDVAREYGYDAVVTISNELSVNTQHPTEGLKVRSNSKVQVHHYSWANILSTAIMCKVHRGVEDPEQAWILGELIRYLESEASGVVAFSDMGANWVAVRDGAKESTLRKNADEVREIAQRWEQLIRFAALRLSAEIGADVQQVFARSEQDPKVRLGGLIDRLCNDGMMTATLKIPNTIGPLTIDADLRARRLVAAVDVPAPTDRGSKARHTWLLRQLGDEAPRGLTIETWPRNSRVPIIVPLADAIEDRDRLEDPEGREILRYRLILRTEMGVARRAGGKSPGFVDSTLGLVDKFYGDVVQGLSPWVPKAPKLRQRRDSVEDAPREPVDSRPDAEEAIADAIEVSTAVTREDLDTERSDPVDPFGPIDPVDSH